MLTRFGDGVSISYAMGGLARRIEDPLGMLLDVLEAAPPLSTYPSCLAVKAAAQQGVDVAFLRGAREGFMCERRRLCETEALVDLARTVPGLDVTRFAIDLVSDAITESFSADLERTRAAAELWRLAAQWKVRPQSTLSGELWEAA